MKKQKILLLIIFGAVFLFVNAKNTENNSNNSKKIAVRKGEILSKELELGALKAINLPMPEASIFIKNIVSMHLSLGLEIGDAIEILQEAKFNIKPIYEKIGDENHGNPSYIFAMKKLEKAAQYSRLH
ncbi:hypothetical protein [Pseudoduganella violacea]|uniref:Uncharacterized protein n=1 Tax=Pseudoduganella violacea TaxID=1715466 RepID=A0A7W5BBY7_9BURK|nr:hypothetical protein [Pseudoduganella violacea]MBB3120153.1 hypothetical protein [Pseudoduganella violacea]